MAGAAPPVAMIEGAEHIGIKLTHVYGLTEVYGPAPRSAPSSPAGTTCRPTNARG
jgi:long-subunit acyl-CoA synthetase (AMP-forming)